MASRMMSSDHLTDEIRKNLVRKVRKYIERSDSEKCKVVIFTDNAYLWKSMSPRGQHTSIRMDEPLPPIPPEYNRQLGYNIVDEMNWFIGEYTAEHEYDVDWNLYDTAEDGGSPQVHIHFAQDHLEPPWLFLKSGPPPPLALQLNTAPSTPLEGGDNLASPTLSIGRERYRLLSPISEKSFVISAPPSRLASSGSQASTATRTSQSSSETYEDALDVLPEEQTLEPESSAAEDDPFSEAN